MLTTDTSDPAEKVAEQRFYPWGQATRYTSGTQKTEGAAYCALLCQCPQ